MPVHHASALAHEPERITVIAKRRSEIIRAENEKRITTAVDYLQQHDILTSSAIRKLSNKGTLSKEMRLAHETANAAALAVGWDEKTDLTRDVDNDDLNIAMTLAAENINTEKLAKQRRGYLAVKFPDWTARQFQAALEQSESQLRLDGSGIEITAINDDRFCGKLLTALLSRLTGKVFDSAALATVVREVLASDASTGKTFGAEIVSGALGQVRIVGRAFSTLLTMTVLWTGCAGFSRNGIPHGSQKMRIPTHSVMPKTLIYVSLRSHDG